MGRWASTEYDRVLVTKVKSLFERCDEAPCDDDLGERRFRIFIKALDPENSAVQACFRSLIQQSTRPPLLPLRSPPPPQPLASRYTPQPARTTLGSARSWEVNSLDPLRLPRPGLHRSPSAATVFHHGTAGSQPEGTLRPARRRRRIVSPPISAFTATISSPPIDTLSPDPISLNDRPPSLSSSQPQSPTPRRVHPVWQRSASPSHSPSRTRHVSLGRPPPTGGNETQINVTSPPHSPSRAWLEEYRQYQGRAESGWMRPSLDASAYYVSHHLWGGLDDTGEGRPQRRRRREEAGLEEGDEEEEDGRGNGPPRRHTVRLAENIPAGSRHTAPDHDEQRRSRDATRRNSRRDGVIFDSWSPELRPLTASAHAGGGNGGLFGSDSHLPDSGDTLIRNPTMAERDFLIDFDAQAEPLPPWPSDVWDEVDSEMASYHYIA
ncbi:MAG: hypothetical protein TREMPRED_002938 [Tremellales sp. Tagirdzhanova-0007]|nr:MAG: hypothetical protein TREMPRED_002938 [Tremellales sp. Tagirdzhanova-0007]